MRILITFIYLNFFLNKNLIAQTFPNYNKILDQKNQSKLAKSIKLALPLAPIWALSGFLTTKIHPLENIPMRNLGDENGGEIFQDQDTISIEEEELSNELSLATNATFNFSFCSLGVTYTLFFIAPVLEYIYSSFEYTYFINDINGKEVCKGSENVLFSNAQINPNPLVSILTWRELISRCDNNIKYENTYFINITDSSGKKIISGKKFIPTMN